VASGAWGLTGPLSSADDWKREVSAAAAFFLPFVALAVALHAFAPPTASQLVAADPLVQAARASTFPGVIVLSSAALGIGWLVRLPPGRAALMRGARQALVAVGVATLTALAVRLALGPALPGFIPPEESARPGMPLGMEAGVVEEALFRLALLPACFALFRRRWSASHAALVSLLVTAVAFAASHELGPGAHAFELRHFATRALIPGAFMSALFFRVGPTFLVTLHCTAHVWIPLLFR
jgi:hypothetical protein